MDFLKCVQTIIFTETVPQMMITMDVVQDPLLLHLDSDQIIVAQVVPEMIQVSLMILAVAVLVQEQVVLPPGVLVEMRVDFGQELQQVDYLDTCLEIGGT